MYQQEGDYARAESVAAEVLTSRRHRSGSQNPNTVSSALDLGLACASEGKFTESEALAREALEFYQKEEPDDWQRYRAESVLGASLAGEKKFAEAEPLLSEGYQGMLARRDRIAIPDRYHLDRAREWLVQLYSAWGKPEKAAEWKKKQNS
jgi:tetratricopeptide (TPR) repeat protein